MHAACGLMSAPAKISKQKQPLHWAAALTEHATWLISASPFNITDCTRKDLGDRTPALPQFILQKTSSRDAALSEATNIVCN